MRKNKFNNVIVPELESTAVFFQFLLLALNTNE